MQRLSPPILPPPWGKRPRNAFSPLGVTYMCYGDPATCREPVRLFSLLTRAQPLTISLPAHGGAVGTGTIMKGTIVGVGDRRAQLGMYTPRLVARPSIALSEPSFV